MRKLFTIDDLVIALVSAVGYGFSFEVPKIFGCPEWMSIVSCLVVGMTLEGLIYKIVFSEHVQTKPPRRFAVMTVLILVALVGVYVAKTGGVSLSNYLEEQFGFVIIPPILVFAFNMALRQYRIKKIRERYGDGSDCFVFDGQVKKKSDLDELNRQNRQIRGAFDNDCAVKTKYGTFVGYKNKGGIFSQAYPMPSRPSANCVGKPLSRCPNRKTCSRQKISARSLFKLITKARS